MVLRLSLILTLCAAGCDASAAHASILPLGDAVQVGSAGDPATRPATTGPAADESKPTPSSAANRLFNSQEIDELVGLVTGNNTSEARRLGAEKLLGLDLSEATERLAGILRANPGDSPACLAVCQAVADRQRPPIVLIDPLLALLGSQQEGLNGAVVDALRSFETHVVIERLRPLAADPSASGEKRAAAIQALGSMGEDIKAVAALVSLTASQDGPIRAAAISALSEAAGVDLADAAAAASWWQQHKSVSPAEWTRQVNDRQAHQIRKLRNEKSLLTTRLAAACREAYLHLPEADRPQKLLLLLSDELPQVRDVGLDLVNALITDRKDIGQEIKGRLVEMISDSDPLLRLKVARVVGDLRLSGAAGRLVEALNSESDPRVRAAVVTAIGRLDGAEAVPGLIQRLKEDAPAVAGEAALALATIARSSAAPDSIGGKDIVAALSQRYALIPPNDEELRVKLLDAMARIGAEAFRQIFVEEAGSKQSPSVRRAAIAGVAGFADLPAADAVLPLTAAPEPEIRSAAVTALGKCGKREQDLAALANRLDEKSESDPAVRGRAWEAYTTICQRVRSSEHFRIAEQFNRPGDKVAQQRRLELLTLLRESSQRFEQLKSKRTDRRIELLEALADAHAQLGQHSAAAASLTQAADLLQGADNPDYARLAVRALVVLLVGREDEAAAQRVRELTDGDGRGDLPDIKPLVEAILHEAQTRVGAITDAASHADAVRTLDLADTLKERSGPDFEQRTAGLRGAAAVKRSDAIDALLGAFAADPQAEPRLLAFKADAVLLRIAAKLGAMSTTTAPASSTEEKLIQFAKRLAPDWPGYSPGCPAEQRATALADLSKLIAEGRYAPGS